MVEKSRRVADINRRKQLTAMALLCEPMATFCAFLENRAATENIPLLYAIATEFAEGSERTLHQFVDLAVNLVVVLPQDVTEPEKRTAAARLLQAQRESPARPDASGVLAFLDHRLVTKNMALFRLIHAEFLEGREDALAAFVRGEEAISIVPLYREPASQPPHWSTYAAPPQYGAPQLGESHYCPQSFHTAYSPAAGSAGYGHTLSRYDLYFPASYTHAAAPPPAPRAADTRASRSLDDAAPVPAKKRPPLDELRDEFYRVEARKPWEQVFHADLAMPFESPKLRAALEHFVRHHGQALWERLFWLPFSKRHDEVLRSQRARRQQSAKKIFLRRVVIPAYKLLGASFFVALDARTSPCDGWWYRRPVVNLGKLCSTKGLAYCLKYLREQALERFPDPHVKRVSKARGHHAWSTSMWSSDTMVAHILQHIQVLKGVDGAAPVAAGTKQGMGERRAKDATASGVGAATQHEDDAAHDDDDDTDNFDSDGEEVDDESDPKSDGESDNESENEMM
ncbi:hypothetical protein PybrP1_011429 [[Pythium] brassicae (nom. inval.)]|nr:hypothetical protein PybrP1_011429 [[Pythium] brassicae (nom. inval.)]